MANLYLSVTKMVLLLCCVTGHMVGGSRPERTVSDLESRLIQLETQVANLQNELQRTRTTRVMTMPEVGFHVKLESTKKFNKDQTIIFDQATTRIGNAYDTKTGVFTCVQPGTYLFSMNIVSGRYNYIEAAIMKNGAPIMNAVSDNHAGMAWNQGGGLVIVYLNTGDKVSVDIVWLGDGVEGTVYGNGLSTFSGYLLRPY